MLPELDQRLYLINIARGGTGRPYHRRHGPSQRPLAVQIARVGGLLAPGESVASGLVCPRWVDRQPCDTPLDVAREDTAIVVHCRGCNAHWHVVGWEGTEADVRASHPLPRSADQRIEVAWRTYDTLRAEAGDDPALQRLIYSAVRGPARRMGLARFDDPATLSVLERLAQNAGRDEAEERLRELLPVAHPSAHTTPSTVTPDNGARPLTLRVSLRHCEPAVWRRLEVPSNLTLSGLHSALQRAMGWEDQHLYRFKRGRRVWRPRGSSFESAFVPTDAETVGDVLEEPGDALDYLYDFGDGWAHEVVLEEVGAGVAQRVQCVDGARACPPENCGGTHGFEMLVAAAEGRGGAGGEELLAWLGRPFDAEHFDLDAVNARLAGA